MESILALIFEKLPSLQELISFLVFLAGSVVAAWLAKIFLEKMVDRLIHHTRTNLDNALVSALGRPLIAAIVITGFYLSLFYLPLSQGLRPLITHGFSTAMALLGIYTAVAVLEALVKWYQIELASKVESPLGHQLVYLSKSGIPLIAVLIAILLILEQFGVQVAPVKEWMAQHGARVVLIVLLAIATIFILDQAIPKIISRSLSRGAGELEEEAGKRANTLARVLVTAGQAFVLFVAIFIVLSELGLNITPVLTGVGVLGIAIGFGAQNLVRDILAGLFVILENQYRVGDVVKVADISGLVEDINLRRTVLRDLDGVVHFVPNGEIKVASNFTKEWSRVNLNISVSYSTDLDKAIAVLNRVGLELAQDPTWAPFILKAPQVLRVDKLGDSGIDIKILGDTKPIKQWDIMGELRKRIKKAFDQEGIEIPWPHVKVYFGDSPFEKDVARDKKQ